MYYRVAIIQNESEMMRYGWADVRPSVHGYGYHPDAYTGENINSLFEKIDADIYDAVLITMNSCNNMRIMEGLCEHRDTSIKHLLETGKGLYVGYQAKMRSSNSYRFLPQIDEVNYDVVTVNRHREREDATEGELIIPESESEHSVVTFPNTIDVQKIVNQSLNNARVTGIYWASLQPCSRAAYQSLIVDTKYEPQRTLLVASRTDLPPRVAISTLPIEWQGHDHLWENILRYVIEGRPSIAIVAKKGSSPESFNYLAATVNMRKLASNSYELRDLQELADLSLGVHDALVLDPSWDEREVLDLNEEIGLISPDTYSRVFYFRKSRQGDRIVSIMSNLKDFNRISRNALTWLVSQYDREKPYWGGSFWTTVEVMKTLHEFGRPIKQYEQGLMAEIKEHNKDGCSYDEVLGATCGLLELCYLLSGKETELYRNALQWVLRVLPEKTLYEQSTALDALLRLGEPIREALLTKFKNELMSTRKGLTNEFALHRFISTLLTCGFVQEAEQLALNLEDLQNPTDGSWINIPNTASTTLTLIHLQNRSPRPNPSIDNMIFKGVLFVKSTYSEDLYSWNNDPLATATSLRALKAFEKNIDFPIDEILRALQDVDEEARSMIAIDAAIQMNIELQEENNRLQQERVRLKDNLDTMRESEAQANKFPRNLSLITSIFSSIVLSSGLAFLYYLLNNQQSANSLLAILEDFVSENLPVVISTLAVIPLILLAILLVKYQMLPKWLEGILSELGVPSSAMKTDED